MDIFMVYIISQNMFFVLNCIGVWFELNIQQKNKFSIN
jgi:hypothetical protein